MSFAIILIMTYALLGLAAWILFMVKRKALGLGVLAMIAVSIAVLIYLWSTSPM